MSHPHHAFLPGASKRLEFLTDGVFAIACTLLVLEIHVPHFKPGISMAEQWHEFSELIPSLIAFGFSFLNILIFWNNHDAISKVVTRFDTKTTFLNIIFLLFISLIPFTTAFIAANVDSYLANICYGLVLCLASLVAVWMYHHLAFKAMLFFPEVSMTSRKRVYKQIVSGPLLFITAIAAGLISNYISIAIYALTPVIFMFLPQLDFDTKEEERNKQE
ncbi:MAG TPA: TMEM175 family protein [Chitinophagaceae bacterium]